MSEEAELKSLRITLSEEAFDRLEQIMKDAKFRSYSSTVEECVRTIYDVMKDIRLIAGKTGPVGQTVTDQQRYELFTRVVTKMGRFTGTYVAPKLDSQ